MPNGQGFYFDYSYFFIYLYFSNNHLFYFYIILIALKSLSPTCYVSSLTCSHRPISMQLRQHTPPVYRGQRHLQNSIRWILLYQHPDDCDWVHFVCFVH
jgi:hypothetical protein